MDRQTITRRHYGDVLMELCKQRRLADLKVADIVAASLLSKQTFYNHYRDFDDLVCHTASRSLLDTGFSMFDHERAVPAAYRYTLEHREFYTQLPAQSGATSYREALGRWMRRKYYEHYVSDVLPNVTRQQRRIKIDFFVAGSNEVAFDWLAEGCAAPIDDVCAAVLSLRPDFMKLPGTRETPPAPFDYPR